MSSSSESLRIAIIGGGIGGLCLAGTIAKFATEGREVVVYEAAADFSEIGAGLSIYGRSFDIIYALDLEADFAAIDTTMGSNQTMTFSLRRSDVGREGRGITDITFRGRAGAFHRGELRSVFARDCERSAKVPVYFKKRLASYTPKTDSAGTSYYELSFADGTSAVCDIVIGADGVRSAVRAAMFDSAAKELGDESLRDFGPPVWSGQCVYRSLIPMDRATEEWQKLGREGPHPLMTGRYSYSGKNKKIIAYAIQNFAFANWGAFVREDKEEGEAWSEEKWVRDVGPEQLRKEFEGWEDAVVSLTNSLTKASRWAIHVARKLPYFAYGNVAVLGDAAHAMTPHNASGANQAIEDAYILGRLLANQSTTRATVHHALQAYDAARRPRAQAIVDISREQGRLTDFTAPEGDDGVAIDAKLNANNIFVATGTVTEDLEKAESILAQRIAESESTQ